MNEKNSDKECFHDHQLLLLDTHNYFWVKTFILYFWRNTRHKNNTKHSISLVTASAEVGAGVVAKGLGEAKSDQLLIIYELFILLVTW